LYVLTRNNEISTFAPKEKIGFAFFFVLSFVFLAAYFFFQEEHEWVCIVGGERRVISTLIRAFFLLSENINLSLSIRRLMYVAVIISMQYFFVFGRELGTWSG
jgi:hypothetical protein